MKCGYCGVEYVDEQAHYCSAGRDLIVAENSRLRAALAAKDAEIEKLKAEIETLAWNLGGISTLACSRKLVEFDSSMARPALRDVAALVRDYAALANAAPEQKPETCLWEDRGLEGWWPGCCDEGDGGCSKWEYPTAPETCPGCGKRVEVRE